MENKTMYDVEIDEEKFEKSKKYVREHYDQIEIEDAGGVIYVPATDELPEIIHQNVATMTAIYPYELRYAFHVDATLTEAEAACGCGCESCGGCGSHDEAEPVDEELARIRKEKMAKLMGHD